VLQISFMNLHFSLTSTVREVKKEFSSYFPYLKIEFYRTGHSTNRGSLEKDKYAGETYLLEINIRIGKRIFPINAEESVGLFETRLQDLGLPVQVFRKSGDIWLETIQTDHLSLRKQNEMGQDSVKPNRFNAYTLFL
jgi:hypothetical protein